MGKLIDFKTGKEIKIKNEINNLESQLKYDTQDYYNSQVLTFLNAFLQLMDMDDEIRKQFTLLIGDMNSSIEKIIAEKNGLI